MPVLFAGVPVSDLAAGLAWHECLHGRPPEMYPNDREACWQVSDQGWVYVVLDPERAGRGLMTVIVDDLDAEVADLAARGLEPVARDTNPLKARYEDPDGNWVVLAQP